MIQSILCACVCITRVFTRVFILFYSFLHRVYLQETPSQDFIKRLTERRLGAGFTWAGRLFKTFGPKTLKRFSLYLTWHGPVTLRFKTFCFRAGFFESNSLKVSYCNLLSYIFLNRDNAIFLLSLCFCLFCL